MNIGAASWQSGVPRKAIRNYESVGLIPEVARASSGYRAHTQSDIDTLRFVQNAPGWDLAYVMWARCWACGTTGRGRARM